MHLRARPPAWTPGCGIVAGLVSGLLGVGGGLVVSPLLILSGLPLRRATGTALAVIPAVACVAVVADTLSLPGNLRVPLALAVAAGGPLGVYCGRVLDQHLPDTILRFLFQVLLVFTALHSLGVLGDLPGGAVAGFSASHPSWAVPLSALLGFAAGICSVLFGVGGGVVVVPGLVFLVGGVDYHAATAASLLAMIPTTLISLRVAARKKRVVWSYLPGLLGGSIPAAALAVWLRNRWLRPEVLSVVFGLFLLLVALRLGFNRDASVNRDPHSPHKS